MIKYLVLILSLISTNFGIQAQTLKDSLLEDIAFYSPTSYNLLMNHDGLESSYNYSRNGSTISTTQNTDTYEFMNWDSYEAALGKMATNIHEICHSYNHYIPYWEMNSCQCGEASLDFIHKGFYIAPGEEYWIEIDKGILFPSRKLEPHISEKNRTLRFSTYIIGEQSAQGHGVLGLLDEFNAYYIGAKYMYDILPCYQNIDKDWGYVTWANWTKGNMAAYFEFDFFIKEYLLFAQRHYPETYDVLKSNHDFLIIYQTIQDNYEKLLNKFENQYKAFYVINESNKDGFRWIMQESIYPDGFTEIQDELSSDKYKQIQNDFGVH